MIIEDLEEVKWRVFGAKPAMGRGVVLPELADVLDLPASRRLAGPFFVFGIRSDSLLQGPSSHAGPIQLELMPTVDL